MRDEEQVQRVLVLVGDAALHVPAGLLRRRIGRPPPQHARDAMDVRVHHEPLASQRQCQHTAGRFGSNPLQAQRLGHGLVVAQRVQCVQTVRDPRFDPQTLTFVGTKPALTWHGIASARASAVDSASPVAVDTNTGRLADNNAAHDDAMLIDQSNEEDNQPAFGSIGAGPDKVLDGEMAMPEWPEEVDEVVGQSTPPEDLTACMRSLGSHPAMQRFDCAALADAITLLRIYQGGMCFPDKRCYGSILGKNGGLRSCCILQGMLLIYWNLQVQFLTRPASSAGGNDVDDEGEFKQERDQKNTDAAVIATRNSWVNKIPIAVAQTGKTKT
ncbi:hypothetical protein BDW74DRAFT_171951 [Aspergillus multicolor]|uniref:uncharacterized protein n=1 Tax=Aspergillus multicolor TaxID=41759 RepID=UPI003CCC978B